MLYLMIGVAVFFWVIVAWMLKGGSHPVEEEEYQPEPRQPQNRILVDGSNVMYWDGETPKIQTVQEVVRLLLSKGYTPGVMFDANAGYLLVDGYKHDREFAGMLGLRGDQVMVVPKGTQADPYLLTAARDLGAQIVTNDFFRDWAKDFPEVRKRGHLIHGGYHNGKLWLDFDGSRQRAQKPRRRKTR
ncbi:Zc3h12a-like ribonuclease protein [Litoreibacter meonggei]|uniref:Zc3h12a-like ribonuclease protein n=1 Tax=Litoreibacter meonggei TaxID=1049199 RepID=A0A497VFV5_9RHOB|nr:hypothetical protein [Litoreibacter meonggei]RLJ41087.1 Zc3h12a-like ribonuclease protein [Litoreibacter meonggei]